MKGLIYLFDLFFFILLFPILYLNFKKSKEIKKGEKIKKKKRKKEKKRKKKEKKEKNKRRRSLIPLFVRWISVLVRSIS